jgi:hypothetical protein
LLLTIAVLARGSFCAAFAASKDGWLSKIRFIIRSLTDAER